MGVMSEARLYLVGSIVMGIAAIVVLCAHNYLAASAMLMSSALAGQHHRVLKDGVNGGYPQNNADIA